MRGGQNIAIKRAGRRRSASRRDGARCSGTRVRRNSTGNQNGKRQHLISNNQEREGQTQSAVAGEPRQRRRTAQLSSSTHKRQHENANGRHRAPRGRAAERNKQYIRTKGEKGAISRDPGVSRSRRNGGVTRGPRPCRDEGDKTAEQIYMKEAEGRAEGTRCRDEGRV